MGQRLMLSATGGRCGGSGGRGVGGGDGGSGSLHVIVGVMVAPPRHVVNLAETVATDLLPSRSVKAPTLTPTSVPPSGSDAEAIGHARP